MKLPVNNICHSQQNGPGNRLVIWTQGCHFHCPGCFNPETHSIEDEKGIDVEQLADRINSDCTIEGITISGGEPLLHAAPLGNLIQKINPALTTILYSGFMVDEVVNDISRMRVITLFDLAIMGRYDNSLAHPFLGKEFMKMSERVDINYFKPRFFVEYTVGGGQVTKTGIFKTN